MKIVFLVIGKTSERWIEDGMNVFFKRLKHYQKTEFHALPDVKGGGKMTPEALKEAEAAVYEKFIESTDTVVLLDENGKEYHSRGFANQIQKWRNAGPKRLVFIVGGAFGFAPSMYERSNAQVSMSKMTTSHQLIRVIFLEQLYRAMTILRGEPYHND
ncbi:MAG: 23S rRNA (pseudouridine(1915)-N(3))-methyltransferase RlmH [Cryomorphaceae bacterium]|nr:23S rRNA (pseudouridine(1915)-N(3))-methyltransferase RlmH [Cryomorphaceae bacterium]